MAKDKLTPKQEAFCREYILDFNGAQAAIRAGYSARTAKEQAARLLTKVHVASRLAELSDDRLEQPILVVDDSYRALKQILDDPLTTPEQKIGAAKTHLDHHAKLEAIANKVPAQQVDIRILNIAQRVASMTDEEQRARLAELEAKAIEP